MNKNEKKTAAKPLADIPLGLSSALSRDLAAMQIFAEMPDDRRNAFIDGAKQVTSKAEMKKYVGEIGRF